MSTTFSVLIVDDDPSNVNVLADILSIKGFLVFKATSGAEALKILCDHPINILLTDVRMPEMNGVELYLETKKTHHQLTTILMTAYAADNIIQNGLANGINTVLNKPMDIDLLLSLLYANKNSLNNDV
jgi:two-component system, NtrC family, response regulator HydG